MNRKLVIIISIIFASVAVVAGTIVMVVVGGKGDDNKEKATADQVATTVATPDEETYILTTTSPATSSPVTQAPEAGTVGETPTDESASVESATEADAAETTVAAVEAPEELSQLLESNGMTAQDMYDNGCRQLVTVRSEGSSAIIEYYTVSKNKWVCFDEMTCNGFVGRNGVTDDMHEGGSASPRGLYTIGEAFYINDEPKTGLNTFQVTENTYWVDDPDSKYYNQRVEGTADQDWNSAEHMIDYSPSYDYGFVINYNTSAEYNKGSAIFFHVSGNPTAGCIGTSTEMVLKYLSMLDTSQNPYILID